MSGHKVVVVPDIGDFDDVEVIEVLVAPGQEVRAEESLITLESDKASMDVPAPEAGRIETVMVVAGDRVSKGTAIVEMSDAHGSTRVMSEAERDAVLAEEQANQAGGTSPAGDRTQVMSAAERDAVLAEQQSTQAGEPSPPEDRAQVLSATERDAVLASASVDEGTLRTKVMTDAERDAALEAAGAPRRVDVLVPDIGEFEGVEVIDVLVKAGDSVAMDDSLITLESDKAAMDVPAPASGVVLELNTKTGRRVSQGDLIAVLEVIGQSGAGTTETLAVDAPVAADAGVAAKPVPVKSQPPVSLPPIDEAGFAKAHAGPSVRRIARELGVDLGRVSGSGVKNRITVEDVKQFVKSILTGHSPQAALPEVPRIDFAKFGEVSKQKLTRIQKLSGPRLAASWVNLPHVTQHDEADTTELEALRQSLKGDAKDRGIRLTPLAFVLRAVVLALKEFPILNSSLDPDNPELFIKHYFHIGFAADTPNGLVVPVIRDADKKNLFQIADELGSLSQAARDGKLKRNQLEGGTFTVSSLGGIGGTAFTPIINAPEVAILGVSRSRMAPVFVDGEFVPRLILPVSLSYDHRVIDGAMAVRFTTRLGQILAEPAALAEDPQA